MKNRRGEMLNVTITDGAHEVDLVFFKAWGHKDALVPGTTARVRRHRRDVPAGAGSWPTRPTS